MDLPIIRELIDLFKQMPGIGEKTATRLAYFVLEKDEHYARMLAKTLISIKEDIKFCEVCGNFSIEQKCEICKDETRIRNIVCVVESPMDIVQIEKARFKGLYHVLHGTLSPLDGIGPDKLNMNTLISRIEKDGIKEVILATNLTTEGEATASYIASLLKNKVKITRIARGLPAGGLIDYSDEITLQKALEGRKEMEV